MAAIDDIPIELVEIILLEWVPPKWRFLTRSVCAQWKRIFDRDGDCDPPVDQKADRRLNRQDTLVPWTCLFRLNMSSSRRGMPNHESRCRWRRGSVVLASAAASWCAVRHATKQESPQTLVDWCATAAGSGIEPAMIAAVLVSTNVPVLAHHAIEVLLPTIDLKQATTSGGGRKKNWYGKSCVDDWSCVWDVHHSLMYRLSYTSHLDTIRVLLPHLGAIVWARVAGIADLLDNIDSDIVRFFLERWHAANIGKSLDGAWHSLGADAVGSVLTLMGAPSPDLFFVGLPFGDNDWDGEFGSVDDHALHQGNTMPGVKSPERDPLSEWLLASWKKRGCHKCAINAAMNGHLGILVSIEPYMTEGLKRKTFRAACRCGQIDIVKWCLRSWSKTHGLEAITVREALTLAVRPYVDDQGYRYASDPPAFLDWIFDPKGGAHIATFDEMYEFLTRQIDRACAFWFVKKRTRDVVALGPSAMHAFVKHACSGNRSWQDSDTFTAGTFERVVRALDRYAAVAATCGATPFQCNLWLVLMDVVRERSRWDDDLCAYDPVRYAWKRVTGEDDVALARPGVRSDKMAPIESWRRWCRPLPVVVTQFWGQTSRPSAGRNVGNMMCWLASKDLLIASTSDPIDLATLASTVPDQEDNNYGDTQWSEHQAALKRIRDRISSVAQV